MTSLVNCAGCNRHIRRSEPACPFCGVAVTSDVAGAPERMLPPTRMSRAALVAFAAAVGTTACSSSEQRVSVPHYGAPMFLPDDASTGGEATSAGGAKGSGGAANAGGASVMALYGAPAAGFPGTGGVTGFGGMIAEYGAPPLIGGGPATGGTNAGGTSAGGASSTGGTTNEADAGDGGPATGGTKGTGGATIAPLYGAPTPIYGAPPSKQ
ncbi:MAG TPA: hypothetical protein VHC69_15065 [Polyangiaceae bacterium]|nr:hypothetical protein [Polyangiaceae bacterium]